MQYRNLGRTGVQVSPLCLGCMNFGRKTAAKDAYHMVDHALDNGINFLDTANVYSTGRSEEITGEALQHVTVRLGLVHASGRRYRTDYRPSHHGSIKG